ncbi:hypothetical protein POTOM_062178 [Populus tomentosa]|uniref:Uncharacterized protein n=1 Tax=Populus tomentosa TaxID=118781 RepID=A0A8X8BV24_POPTO|nr:hypothetical protein POTOM_062178 [Populus tomentosa]
MGIHLKKADEVLHNESTRLLAFLEQVIFNFFIAVSKRFKDQVLMLEVPMRGVAPLLEAMKKLHSSSEHLTALRPDFLQLCLLAKCYKTGLSILEDDVFQVLGRLASQISTVIQGKDKPTYAPYRDDGDICVVLNAKDVCVTGRKMTDKFYRWHTGQVS